MFPLLAFGGSQSYCLLALFSLLNAYKNPRRALANLLHSSETLLEWLNCLSKAAFFVTVRSSWQDDAAALVPAGDDVQ